MRRAALVLGLVLALGAAPAAAAQDSGEIELLLTTPDGNLACREDFPGASYEANLVAAGYTLHYAVTGHDDAGASIALELLCNPTPIGTAG